MFETVRKRFNEFVENHIVADDPYEKEALEAQHRFTARTTPLTTDAITEARAQFSEAHASALTSAKKPVGTR